MVKFNNKLLGIAVAGMLAAGPVGAVTFGTSADGTGMSLNDILNNITTKNRTPACDESLGDTCSTSVDMINDQVSGDAYWQVEATGGSVSTIVIEVAGNAGKNTFGIFDKADETNTLQLFDGLAGATDQVTLSVATTVHGDYQFSAGGTTKIFGGDTFGYYLSGPGGKFYSDSNKNLFGDDQMVAYQGKGTRGQDYLEYGNGIITRKGWWTSASYMLGWEDLPVNTFGTNGGSDKDYQDFVVLVESIVPVPAPATLALLGLGLLGIGYSARRKTA